MTPVEGRLYRAKVPLGDEIKAGDIVRVRDLDHGIHDHPALVIEAVPDPTAREGEIGYAGQAGSIDPADFTAAVFEEVAHG